MTYEYFPSLYQDAIFPYIFFQTIPNGPRERIVSIVFLGSLFSIGFLDRLFPNLTLVPR